MTTIEDFHFLSARDPESHKGDYGHALLVAGSYGKMGAAVLAARACLRSGIGLLTVHIPRCGVGIMQTAVPEAMLSIDEGDYCFSSLPKDIDRYTAIAAGPGLGTNDATQCALLQLLEAVQSKPKESRPKLVLDADALNILARHPDRIHLATGAVITPHNAEYQRLFGDADTQAMADVHDVVIVRKAHRTRIYAPNAAALANDTGNAGMATAGSGDVLTGIALGLVAQAAAYGKRHTGEVYGIQQLAALAAYVHGRAGDIAAERLSQASMIASDIVDSIPLVI